MSGILYVVATPIGNLKDITDRAVEVLREADIVVAENLARALKLLNHLSIKKRIISINSYNEERKAQAIVEHLLKGRCCALISSAGTPCISDPGNTIVRKCHEAGVAVRAIPGPSAAVGAISISGLYADRFLFFGFLPQKKGKKRKILGDLLSLPYPIIFFESPRRLIETLNCIYEEFGNRYVVILKEMTKLHEEIFRGSVEALINQLSIKELKGEYTIIVHGKER